MGFTKLDSGIVDSSIWSEPYSTRVVWITMLAKCDHNGFVSASRSGLLRSCNVLEEEFNAAINILESPDPDSRTPDNNGKRIEKVDGGWIVLNYKKYREYTYSSNPDAIRQRKHREKTVTNCDMSRLGCDISASASVSASDKSVTEKEERLEQAPWKEKCSTFEKYQAWELEEYNLILNNREWISQREEFHRGLDIKLSLKKAHTDFWSTKAGWKNIRSRRGDSIDWPATWVNALAMKCNQVWKSSNRQETQDEIFDRLEREGKIPKVKS